MTDLNNLHPENALIQEFIQASLDESQAYIDSIIGQEDEPRLLGYAEYGVPWTSGACRSKAGFRDVAAYKASVENTDCSAWMDNTTIVTACALMSKRGPDVMTPLTVWDLATFIRAVICYERIYHHQNSDFDDKQVNKLLDDDVFKSIPLPYRPPKGPDHPLPDPWDGAHMFMCDIWVAARNRLEHLYESVGTNTLDGMDIQRVTEAWQIALGNNKIQPAELVNFRKATTRWGSPSNQLLAKTAKITKLEDTHNFLDPEEWFQKPIRETEDRSDILTDLNIRAYINQQLAEFFELPYACSAGRLPFRNHLYNRALQIQQKLTVAGVIDNRYAELAQDAQLRLPIFLAIALREADKPEDLWPAVAAMRTQASAFRTHREDMDRALARRDLKAASKISKALQTSVDSLLKVAVEATAYAGVAVLEDLSKGDIDQVKTSIGAALAATESVIKSSFADRLLWRLHRPQLLWINDMVDQAHHLTEALPDFSRVWEIPTNRQEIFAERFRNMARLAS